jgi:hypothetical protein
VRWCAHFPELNWKEHPQPETLAGTHKITINAEAMSHRQNRLYARFAEWFHIGTDRTSGQAAGPTCPHRNSIQFDVEGDLCEPFANFAVKSFSSKIAKKSRKSQPTQFSFAPGAPPYPLLLREGGLSLQSDPPINLSVAYAD